ncbi:hypothetical protein HOLleu_16372 [Holothuria leucospilota]|uniref:CCHC-type domain-containing protein n=1 Tax=Holothuria leucospilota TaxID=206669 RepID=A0A9Q1H7R9_HOLLE|nr:hypothetical protein HOLleu_16372 [Holothuria leucospilota]
MFELASVYYDLDELLAQADQIGSKYDIFEKIESEHYALIKKVSEFTRYADETESNSSFKGSKGKSKSQSSRSSFSIKADAAVQAASLQAKLKYIDVKARYKTELEKIKLEIAGAESKAVDEVNKGMSINLAEELPDESVRYTEEFVQAHSNPHVEPSTSNVSGPGYDTRTTWTNIGARPSPFVPDFSTSIPVASSGFNPTVLPIVTTSQSTVPVSEPSSQVDNFAKVLAEQVTLHRLPIPEPGIFDGDPLQYPGWKCALDTLLENKGIPPSEKIYYLKKYLSGPPREALEGYFLVPSNNTYSEARKLLEARYGNHMVIADAFRTKLDAWPKIQPNDGLALRKFADFLGQCESAMGIIPGSLTFLNDNWENRKILCKLPTWLVTRWGRFLASWGENRGFPPFSQFRQFVTMEANIACNPVTSLQSLKAVKPSDSKSSHKRGHSSSNSLATEASPVTNSNQSSIVKVKCVLCQGQHGLNDCNQFLSKTLEERKTYVRTGNLCYGCLRHGHRSKFCRNRLLCKKCSKHHPTSLHGDVKVKNAQNGGRTGNQQSKCIGTQTSEVHSGLSNMSGTSSVSMSSLTVPVYVSHKDSPGKEILVYALLDTQSDTTFVSDRTCELLGIEGTETLLKLSTMSGKNQVINTNRVDGLVVRGYKDLLQIPLPIAFTRCDIPVNRSHISTPEMASQWPHLQSIAHELMPASQCDVGLLIGYNCPRALTPRKVISHSHDGPYAQKTDLGWGIVGVVNAEEVQLSDHDPIGLSHFIVTSEVADVTKLSNCSNKVQVCFECNVKEIITPIEVARLMELEFNERNLGEMSYSQDDKRFLSILQNGICQLSDGHYQLPLPLKTCQDLPNNKSLAMYRLNRLQRRLRNDAVYARDYNAFMQDIISKGYAEKVPSSELSKDTDVNYIPHHGVYHPNQKARRLSDSLPPRGPLTFTKNNWDHLLNMMYLVTSSQLPFLRGCLQAYRHKYTQTHTKIRSSTLELG